MDESELVGIALEREGQDDAAAITERAPALLDVDDLHAAGDDERVGVAAAAVGGEHVDALTRTQVAGEGAVGESHQGESA